MLVLFTYFQLFTASERYNLLEGDVEKVEEKIGSVEERVCQNTDVSACLFQSNSFQQTFSIGFDLR